MKTYQKAAALLLALALIFAFPVPASAAETTEARVPVTLTVVNTVLTEPQQQCALCWITEYGRVAGVGEVELCCRV